MATTVEQFANLPSTTVSSGGGTAPAAGTQETWTVGSSAGFPGANSGATPPTQFHVADQATGKTGEIIAVINVSGTTWTVTRGAENTTPVAHQAGFTVYQVVTAGALGGMLQSASNLSDVASASTARANLGLGSAATISAPVSVANGGTGQTTAGAALAALGGAAVAGDIGGTSASPQVTGTHLAAALPVAQGGTGQATQQAALDALAGAQTANQVLAGNGTHVTLRALAAADLPAATTSTQGAVVLDGTAADIQPVGVGAAGAKGQAADALHVHPYEPYQFYVASSGAKGDGRYVVDAATTTGASSNFTSATAAFTAGDVGKVVFIIGAGAAGANLSTTISAFVNSATVTLAATPGTAVTSKFALIGTDDTSAVKSAVSSASSYATAHDGYAEIVFDPLIYIINGAPVINPGNAQIPLPVIATTAKKVTLVFRGVLDSASLPHWQQTVPELSGTTLACTRLDGTNDVTNGPAVVIGGPVNGYGAAGGNVFDNIQPVIDGIRIAVPYNSTYGGCDFYGCGEAAVISASVMPFAIVPAGGALPSMSNPGASAITNQWSYGLRMPDCNNNDRCDVLYFSAYAMTYGFMPAEHVAAESVRCNYCVIGIEAYGGANTVHGNVIKRASVEACSQGLGFLNSRKLDIHALDTENLTNVIYDPSNFGQGEIRFRSDAGTGYVTSGVVNSGTGLRIINLSQPSGPVASPQAAPATTVAWRNNYYRDAEITLSVSAGTLSALSIDAVAQTVPASTTFYRFTLPSGHSYTPTYTGTLTHTVTLL